MTLEAFLGIIYIGLLFYLITFEIISFYSFALAGISFLVGAFLVRSESDRRIKNGN